MMSSAMLTSALFVPSGIVSVSLGLVWLGVLSVAYGVVSVLWHECSHASLASQCTAGFIFDSGLLTFADTYLERLVSLYSLSAFLFRPGCLRVATRSAFSFGALLATVDTKMSAATANAVIIGMGFGLWLLSYATKSSPRLDQKATWASIVVYTIGATIRYAGDYVKSAPTRSYVAWEVLDSTSIACFALNVTFVALAVRTGGRRGDPEGEKCVTQKSAA
jgi:hypothetical protein